MQAMITKSSLWAVPRTLVYRDKILCPCVKEYSFNEGIKERYPLKRCYFAAIGSYSVKTVADRYRHATYHITSTNNGLFRFINIDDLG